MRKLLLRRTTEEDTPRAGPPPTPGWVKVFGIITLVLALMVIIMIFTGVGGEHGPGRHIPSGDDDGRTPPIEQGGQQP